MRRAGQCWVGALALLVTFALPVSIAAGAQAPESVRLTDGRAFAHWAHPEHRAVVRRVPSRRSRRVAGIHYFTEDGFPEVYPALRRFTDRHGLAWLRIRIPMRPDGRTGWVQEGTLGPLHRVRTRLVVDHGRLRATLYGRPSHGCTRVPNHAIVWLYRLMPIGTSLRIHAESAHADGHRQRRS